MWHGGNEWLLLVDHQRGIFLRIGERTSSGWVMENIRLMQELVQSCFENNSTARLEILPSGSLIARSIISHYRQAGFGQYEKYVPSLEKETTFVIEEERYDNRSAPRETHRES